MSNHLAIGGVSLTLKALLEDRMEFARPGLPANEKVLVTISAPDVTHANVTGPRLNLFLYHISESPFLKNQEIPGHGHPSDYGHPPLSLDLHYLITTYSVSEQDDVLAHQVLGDAMRVLHDFSIITDGLVREHSPGNVAILDPSLLGQFERVKITLAPMGFEETAKIWTAMPEVSLRCSVAYQVSVVQIESRRIRPVTLPVRARHILAIPFTTPQILEAYRDPPLEGIRSPVAAVSETIRIRGVNLGGAGKRVLLRGVEMPPAAAATDEERLVTVPAAVPAGAHVLQVVQNIVFGVTSGAAIEEHQGFHSNAAALLVIPSIIAVNPATAAAGATVTFTLSPAVHPGQNVELLLGDHTIVAAPLPSGSPPSATVPFELPATLPAASYLMRVRVDGAESRLTKDPVTRSYTGPSYSVM